MKPFRYPYHEKKHRLDMEIYKGRLVISFTLCIKNRKELFVDDKVFQQFESLLLKELREQNCSAFAYLFMLIMLIFCFLVILKIRILKSAWINLKSKPVFGFTRTNRHSNGRKIIMIIF